MLIHWYNLQLWTTRWWGKQYYFYKTKLRVLKFFNRKPPTIFLFTLQCIFNFYKLQFKYWLYLKMSLITSRNLNFYYTALNCAVFIFKNLGTTLYSNFTFQKRGLYHNKFRSYRPALNLRYHQFIYARRQRLILYNNVRSVRLNLRRRHLGKLINIYAYKYAPINVLQLLQYSNLVTDINLLKYLFLRGYIFVNGFICLNYDCLMSANDCIQITINKNLLLYFYRKLLYQSIKNLRRRKHISLNFLIYKKLIYNTTFVDTPLFLEVDHTTLTCFYLYKICNKYVWSWNYLQFIFWRFTQYYNWGLKY